MQRLRRPAGLCTTCSLESCRHDGGECSGLQVATIRNLVVAWVLTLPAAMLISGSLYWLFTMLF